MFSDSDRSEGAEEGKRDGRRGLFPWHSGGCLRGKQVGRSVMREDSWQVQRRLTAKRRWQRGKTEGLSRASLCERFLTILFSCSQKVFGDEVLFWEGCKRLMLDLRP